MTQDELKEFSAIYHHKFIVLQYMNSIIQELLLRAEQHDQSKFNEDEFVGLVQATNDIKKYPYGSSEYEEMRVKHSKIFQSHYAKNRHHPEHHANGIEDMNLVDLIEMLIDWKAASMRQQSGGNIANSIKIGADKYKISPQLVKILENTAKMYKL